MTNAAEQVKESTLSYFDREVRELPQIDYKEVLEEIISDLQSRLDCVNEELAGSEEE